MYLGNPTSRHSLAIHVSQLTSASNLYFSIKAVIEDAMINSTILELLNLVCINGIIAISLTLHEDSASTRQINSIDPSGSADQIA